MGCQPRYGRNTRILLQRFCRRLFILELFCLWFSCNITYHPKARYAYCGSSILMGGVPYTGIKKEYKNGLRRMETLTIVESGGLACYHWKMFHITIRSKTGGTDHGCEYNRTVGAGSDRTPRARGKAALPQSVLQKAGRRLSVKMYLHYLIY